MQRPKNEDLILIHNIPKLIYKLTGTARTRTCIYGWIKDGRVTYEGERIKLRTVVCLGFLYTTREWVEEFIGRL